MNTSWQNTSLFLLILNVNSAACFLLPCCTKFYFFRNFIINYPIVANCISNFYPGCLSMCSTATRYEWCPILCEVRHIESGDVTDTGNMYVLHCGTCPWRPSIWHQCLHSYKYHSTSRRLQALEAEIKIKAEIKTETEKGMEIGRETGIHDTADPAYNPLPPQYNLSPEGLKREERVLLPLTLPPPL